MNSSSLAITAEKRFTFGVGSTLTVIGIVMASFAALPSVPASAAPGTPFVCTSDFFWVQNSQLLKGNPAQTPFGTNVGPANPSGPYNAIGYNPQDNFIYGLGYSGSTILNQLVQVDSSGTVTALGIPAGLPTTNSTGGAALYNAGAMDDSGNLWVSQEGDFTLYAIDIATNAVVDTVTPTPMPTVSSKLFIGADIVWKDGSIIRTVNSTGLSSGRIIVTETATGATTDTTSTLGAVANLGSPAAMWLTSDNRLFITSAGGGIVEITNWQTNAFRRVVVSTSGVSSSGDGASCLNAPSPFGIAATDDDYTDTPVTAADGGTVGNIWSNDLFDSTPLDHTTVTTTLTDAGGLTGSTIGVDGSVTIPGGFAAGHYTLRYSICAVATPTVCSQASITVLLTAPTPSESVSEPELAATGVDIPWLAYSGAGLLVVAGLMLTVDARRRRRLTRFQ